MRLYLTATLNGHPANLLQFISLILFSIVVTRNDSLLGTHKRHLIFYWHMHRIEVWEYLVDPQLESRRQQLQRREMELREASC